MPRVERELAGSESGDRQQSLWRDDARADLDRHYLHAPQLHRRAIRYELRPRSLAAQHAGARLVCRLSDGVGFDGVYGARVPRLLLALGLATSAKGPDPRRQA